MKIAVGPDQTRFGRQSHHEGFENFLPSADWRGRRNGYRTTGRRRRPSLSSGEMLARQNEIGHLLAESTSDTKSTARLLEEHQSIDEGGRGDGLPPPS